jgi:hypothetical protein
MASDALAPAVRSAAPSEEDYQTFCAALTASARGRAFLAEYARRHRGADTETLLAALARLEMLMRAQAHVGAGQQQAELRRLIRVIRTAKPDLAQSTLPARAAKLAVLLDLLERRLAAMAEQTQGIPEAAQIARLAVVPPPAEPELPIPTPAATQPPALALAHDRGPPPTPVAPENFAGTAASIPEVGWFDSAPPAAAAAEIAAALPPLVAMTENAPPRAEAVLPAQLAEKATAPTVAAEQAMAPAPTPPDENLGAHATAKIATPPPDPLAALMALSEEERIALFT